jgi:hypothetical protein
MRKNGRDLDRMKEGLHSTRQDLDRKFWLALVLFAALAALAWFTVGEGVFLVHGRPVELRILPMIIIGGMALRTVLAHHAEKTRRSGDGGGSTTPKSL